MCDVGGKAQKMLECQSWYVEDEFDVDVNSHTVPYVVWSNYGLEMDQLPMLDIGHLLPTVLQEADIDIPYFWTYLQEIQSVLPAFNHAVFINSDNSLCNMQDLEQEQRELYRNFELLTYDYIWGERYAVDLWKKTSNQYEDTGVIP